ncbi:jg4145 [Pararge aegeria aegeria]|uniref:Jg4145 protein n=1 Tax=Pararge aegeria aegeria TaxID=348720 RepID=A0A8S4RCC9_9NEOP|nr:jg4145 [Pararge aegeria aegeria]
MVDKLKVRKYCRLGYLFVKFSLENALASWLIECLCEYTTKASRWLKWTQRRYWSGCSQGKEMSGICS